MSYRSGMPTAFEEQIRRLGLDERTCVGSKQLREWCERNKEQCYIPEWLLKQWGISVDSDLTSSQEGQSLVGLLSQRGEV